MGNRNRFIFFNNPFCVIIFYKIVGDSIKFFKAIKNFFFKTPARTIFTIYFLFALVGGFLLWLPINHKSGVSLSFLDALFISVSQMSSTGLSPVSLYDTFNVFGGIISIIILQVGGVGIVLLIASYWVFTGKRIGHKERSIIAFEQNQFTIKGIIKLISNAIIMIFSIQLVFIIIMSIYLYLRQPWSMHIGESIFHSFFLAASGFGNAGFEMFPTKNSFMVFQQEGLYFGQVMVMLLIFMGGIGFWPLAELALWIKAKLKRQKYKFSFISKLFVTLHFSTLLITMFIYTLLEYNNTLHLLTPTNQVFEVLFMSVSARSAGFSNANLISWRESTKLFMAVLMFIGAAPNSSGGGIRLTTFVLVVSALYAFGRRRKQVFLGGKAIKDDAVRRAYTVFSMGFLIMIIATFLILTIENLTFTQAFFEVMSAFGTVGLSLGVTPLLSGLSKFILIITMFIGRIGILTFIQMLEKKETINIVTYAEIDMMVG
ncbi:MAG: potassium transporter TrkG [Acholeplasmataceae bacterium]